MAQLSTNISSILRDMVSAQHEANMYAASLEEIYRRDGRLERFHLPAIALGELELGIQYGVKDDSAQKEQFEINYPALRTLSKEISSQLANTVLASVLKTFQEAMPANSAEGEDNPVLMLNSAPDMKRDFCAYLSRKILKSFRESFLTLINDDGTANRGQIMKCVISTCEEEVLNNKDFNFHFDQAGGTLLREKVRQDIRQSVKTVLDESLKDLDLKRKKFVPSLDVTVNSEEIAKLPDECVHTLHLKLDPRDIRLYQDENK